ncbi:MAG: alcohol dehydrogenase catalytic domain-containing protein [Planctomycetes bacterium]|nr:alcohol dehydrogenase catalytic domain-containing protein [Planctomycetota bacterium]
MRYRALVLSGKKSVAVEMRETATLQPNWVRVKLAYGGICGSDLHYFHDFGNVGFTLRNPVVMGHEASGVVEAVGPEVDCLAVGDKVAVNPMMNCGSCLPCRQGRINLCVRKRFPCSAQVYPHVDGFFREYFEIEAHQCVKLPPDAALENIVFAEPLACSLHAVQRLGDLVGKTVLITGAGPIGLLAMMVAKLAGARSAVVTDIADEPLVLAKALGADQVINSSAVPIHEWGGMNFADAAVEASGAPAATTTCMQALRKGGVMVQLGTSPGGNMAVPWVMFQSKEIDVFGTSQFCAEFDTAVDLLLSGLINPQPLVHRQVRFEDGPEVLAAGGSNSGKTQFVP